MPAIGSAYGVRGAKRENTVTQPTAPNHMTENANANGCKTAVTFIAEAAGRGIMRPRKMTKERFVRRTSKKSPSTMPRNSGLEGFGRYTESISQNPNNLIGPAGSDRSLRSRALISCLLRGESIWNRYIGTTSLYRAFISLAAESGRKTGQVRDRSNSKRNSCEIGPGAFYSGTFPALCTVAYASGSISAALQRRPAFGQITEKLAGGLVVLLGVRLATCRR
jgi:hypothetical protein